MPIDVIDDVAPPMWRIEAGSQPTLCFGASRIALSDVASVEAEEIRDRPVAGLILAMMLFVLISALLAFGVFEAEMRQRFLLGTVLLGFLGYMGATELPGIKTQSIYEVRIKRASGGIATFVSADRADVERLLARLS